MVIMDYRFPYYFAIERDFAFKKKDDRNVVMQNRGGKPDHAWPKPLDKASQSRRGSEGSNKPPENRTEQTRKGSLNSATFNESRTVRRVSLWDIGELDIGDKVTDPETETEDSPTKFSAKKPDLGQPEITVQKFIAVNDRPNENDYLETSKISEECFGPLEFEGPTEDVRDSVTKPDQPDSPFVQKEASTNTQEESTKTQKESTNVQEDSTDVQNISTEIQEVSNDVQKISSNGQRVFTKVLEVPMKTQKVTTSLHVVSTDVHKVSTNVQEEPTDIRKISNSKQGVLTDIEEESSNEEAAEHNPAETTKTSDQCTQQTQQTEQSGSQNNDVQIQTDQVVKTDVQTQDDVDFPHLKVTKNLDFNVNKQKLSLSKRGGLAKRRKPSKLQKSKGGSEQSESEASEPSDGTSHDSDAEDAHLQKVKAMGGVPTAIVTSGIKDLCVEKLRLLKVSPKDENKQAGEDPPWVKAAMAIKERAFAHVTEKKTHQLPNQFSIPLNTRTPASNETINSPVSSILLDEIEKNKNSKNAQESKLFNQTSPSSTEKGKRNSSPNVVDENKPPVIHAFQMEKCLPWKPKLSSPRLGPRLFTKFNKEPGQREPLCTTDSAVTPTSHHQKSSVSEETSSSSVVSPEWIKSGSGKGQQNTSCEIKVEEMPESSSNAAPWQLELTNRKKLGRSVLKVVEPVTSSTEKESDLPDWVKQARRRRERLAEFGLIEEEVD